MTSKQVTDRARSARAVEAAALTHLPTLGARASQALAGALEADEAVPDVALLVRLHTRLMMQALARLEAADLAHRVEQADDATPRAERAEAAAACTAALQDLRSLITSLYPPEVALALHLTRAPERLPDALSQQADAVASALPHADLSAPRVQGLHLDLAPFQARLDDARSRLSDALRAVATERREAEQTQRAKDVAMRDFDDAFTAAAGLLAHLLRLHGEPELARRVRPSKRQPGRRAVDVGEEPGASDEG